ncbi:MAG: hypothetical protein GXO72_04615, partial [Caldiserica bacterium]|nr:hypothetical protein [Caldisericota bacterium]
MAKWWVAIGVGALALVLALVLLPRGGQGPAEAGEISLAELEAEVIPPAGQETSYGIPLSWDNAQMFADWYYEVRLSPEEARVLQRALGDIPTPCCDDTRITRCCCERSGLICNLVRSARGLAAWLIQRKGFDEEGVEAAVREWVKFAHRQYFLAVALAERGAKPSRYGLTTRGACYRDRCELPMRQGGCGGMGDRVRICPPEAATSPSCR